MGSRVSLWGQPPVQIDLVQKAVIPHQGHAGGLARRIDAKDDHSCTPSMVILRVGGVHRPDVHPDGIFLVQQGSQVLAPFGGHHRSLVQIVVKTGGGQVVFGVDAVEVRSGPWALARGNS